MGAMFSSEDFKADFALQKCCWFYHQTTRKRCLILEHKAKKDTVLEQQKAMIASAKKAAT